MFLNGVRNVFIMLELHEQFRFPVSAVQWPNNYDRVSLFHIVGVVRIRARIMAISVLLMSCSTRMWDMS